MGAVQRRLMVKTLPRPAVNTVLALRAVRVEDDIGLLGQVAELATFGCDPKLILLLVGDVGQTAINRMCRKHGKLRGGHPPSTIAGAIINPQTHLQSSIFLNHFISYHHLSGASEFLPEVFIRAFRHYRDLVLHCHGAAPLLTPWHAYVVSTQYVTGESVLTPCACGVRFLQSVKPVYVQKNYMCGSCPACALDRRRLLRRKREQDALASGDLLPA